MEPWLSKLNAGQGLAAWDLFVERYRRLILASIRRLVQDHDDVMDVFSSVCQALSANDFARLRRYSGQSARGASVATWVVAVVRNLTIDWIRKQEGRRRISVPPMLSPLQQEIYTAICINGCSYVEAFETIRARSGSLLSFPEFLRELRLTHRIAPCPGSGRERRPVHDSISQEIAAPAADPAETAESIRRMAHLLASQPDDVRVAVELFIVERMSAAAVAGAVGWPNAKTVYNRVYRALASLRAGLEREGIGPGDL